VTTAEKPARGSLLEQLMAAVRPEFRAEVYVPAPNDPVFISDQCIVADCDRTAEALRQRLCCAHSQRFRKGGYRSMAEFLADPGPPTRGRKALAACVVTECKHGRWDRNGLCRKHSDWWKRAGRPDLVSWKAPDATPSDPASAECRLPFCDLWVGSPTKLFCPGHDDRWVRHGRPDLERFIADCELVGTAHIDLRALARQPRLEIQYALQCRNDTRSRTAPPRLVIPAVRLVEKLAIASLLELSEQEWRLAAATRPDQSLMFLLDARDAVEALRDGIGWEIEYPRDVWRLDKLPGVAAPASRPCPRARLQFDRITQPWLRDLGKRWTRLRLTSGLGIGAARAGVDALIRFSDFLTLVGVNTLADVNRPLLERYLARVMSQPGGPSVKKTRIGALNVFFQAVRQHGWDDSLPGGAGFYAGDTPPIPAQLDRRLAEFVMTQVRSAGRTPPRTSPRHLPQSRSASRGSTVARRPSSSAVWRVRFSGPVSAVQPGSPERLRIPRSIDASTCRRPVALSGSSVANRPPAIASVMACDTNVSRTTSVTQQLAHAVRLRPLRLGLWLWRLGAPP